MELRNEFLQTSIRYIKIETKMLSYTYQKKKCGPTFRKRLRYILVGQVIIFLFYLVIITLYHVDHKKKNHTISYVPHKNKQELVRATTGFESYSKVSSLNIKYPTQKLTKILL